MWINAMAIHAIAPIDHSIAVKPKMLMKTTASTMLVNDKLRHNNPFISPPLVSAFNFPCEHKIEPQPTNIPVMLKMMVCVLFKE